MSSCELLIRDSGSSQTQTLHLKVHEKKNRPCRKFPEYQHDQLERVFLSFFFHNFRLNTQHVINYSNCYYEIGVLL